jgi:hypothetical protein
MVATKADTKTKTRGDGPVVVTFVDDKGKNDYRRVLVTLREGLERTISYFEGLLTVGGVAALRDTHQRGAGMPDDAPAVRGAGLLPLSAGGLA